jgi:hypothetical protein
MLATAGGYVGKFAFAYVQRRAINYLKQKGYQVTKAAVNRLVSNFYLRKQKQQQQQMSIMRKKRKLSTISKIPRFLRGYVRRSGVYGRFGRRYQGGRVISKPGENKFLDGVTGAWITATLAGVNIWNSLNLIDQGTGECQMIGRIVHIKQILIRMMVRLPDTFNATLNQVPGRDTIKLIVVLDRQANGTAASFTDVFEDADINSLRDLENSKRFTILKSKIVTISTVVNNNGTNYYHAEKRGLLNCYLKFKRGIKIEYSPQAGANRTISEVRSNNILVMAISTNGQIQVNGRFRVRYNDA